MSDSSNVQKELERIRDLASSAYSTRADRNLLTALISVLLGLGLLLLVLAYAMQNVPTTYGSVHFWGDLALNMGTELIGSLIIFVLIGLAVRFFAVRFFRIGRLNIGRLNSRHIVILLVCSVGAFLWSSRVFYTSFYNDLRFVSSIFSNLAIEISGSLIIYAVLENVVRALERREQTTEILLKRIDSVAKSFSDSETGRSLPSVPAAYGSLEILSAMYGAEDQYNDVANVVRSAIVAGGVEMPVNNDYFGPDPIKRVPKELIVNYLYAGRKYSKTVPERATLLLP